MPAPRSTAAEGMLQQKTARFLREGFGGVSCACGETSLPTRSESCDVRPAPAPADGGQEKLCFFGHERGDLTPNPRGKQMCVGTPHQTPRQVPKPTAGIFVGVLHVISKNTTVLRFLA